MVNVTTRERELLIYDYGHQTPSRGAYLKTVPQSTTIFSLDINRVGREQLRDTRPMRIVITLSPNTRYITMLDLLFNKILEPPREIIFTEGITFEMLRNIRPHLFPFVIGELVRQLWPAKFEISAAEPTCEAMISEILDNLRTPKEIGDAFSRIYAETFVAKCTPGRKFNQ